MPIRDLSIIKLCKVCKKEFHPYKKRPGKFCSAICQRKGRTMRPIVYFEGLCEWCKESFKRPKYNTDKTTRFCSIQCMANMRGKNMAGENHPKWKGGSNRVGSFTICNRIKKEIGECQKCGSLKNLDIHHKIPVSQAPELAADPKNMEVLCRKCHAKEHPEFMGMLLCEKRGTEKECANCKKNFYVRNHRRNNAKYCCKVCQMDVQKTGFYKNCEWCGAEYKTIPSRKNSKFCSNRCKMLERHLNKETQ